MNESGHVRIHQDLGIDKAKNHRRNDGNLSHATYRQLKRIWSRTEPCATPQITLGCVDDLSHI